ncbi:unnamed protein product [Paramecium primaurelia]|uniref:Uncharacterized protein n=1 Tax=Paramecium primaurelia TaxID=5886 RepID=A0A8S1KIR4_PARPR|nr:unnamed protein product [Paramecium primaurelia]
MYLDDRLIQKSQYQQNTNQSIQFKDSINQRCEISKYNKNYHFKDKLLSQLTLADQYEIFDAICIRRDFNSIIILLRNCRLLKIISSLSFKMRVDQILINLRVVLIGQQMNLKSKQLCSILNNQNSIRNKVYDCISNVIKQDQNTLNSLRIIESIQKAF